MTRDIYDSLLEVQDKLRRSLESKHREADTGSKDELIEAIRLLEEVLEAIERGSRTDNVIRLLGKVVEKLPWIAKILKELE